MVLADVREVTLSPLTEIPLLFLVAGLLTPASVEGEGPGRFARDRLMHLGTPFVIFVGLIWPLLLYALYRPLGNAPGSYWSEFVGTRRREPAFIVLVAGWRVGCCPLRRAPGAELTFVQVVTDRVIRSRRAGTILPLRAAR